MKLEGNKDNSFCYVVPYCRFYSWFGSIKIHWKLVISFRVIISLCLWKNVGSLYEGEYFWHIICVFFYHWTCWTVFPKAAAWWTAIRVLKDSQGSYSKKSDFSSVIKHTQNPTQVIKFVYLDWWWSFTLLRTSCQFVMQCCSAFSDSFPSVLALAMGEILLAVSHILSTNMLLSLSISKLL